MRMVSWNVNGLRAVMNKNFCDIFEALDADLFALQETKLQEGQIDLHFPGYCSFWNYAEKKGYSGTAVFSRYEPLAVNFGIGEDEHDHEGRVITLRFKDFYFVTVYVPNSQDGLRRLDYRMRFEDAFRAYLKKLDAELPVIVCGDLNVAHREIDLKNPQSNHHNAGFSDEERGKFGELLSAGFIDSFRFFEPEAADAYTWWSYRSRARERNAGWRIDYFCCSERLGEQLLAANIHDDVYGSDHCPVSLEIDVDLSSYTTPREERRKSSPFTQPSEI